MQFIGIPDTLICSGLSLKMRPLMAVVNYYVHPPAANVWPVVIFDTFTMSRILDGSSFVFIGSRDRRHENPAQKWSGFFVSLNSKPPRFPRVRHCRADGKREANTKPMKNILVYICCQVFCAIIIYAVNCMATGETHPREWHWFPLTLSGMFIERAAMLLYPVVKAKVA